VVLQIPEISQIKYSSYIKKLLPHHLDQDHHVPVTVIIALVHYLFRLQIQGKEKNGELKEKSGEADDSRLKTQCMHTERLRSNQQLQTSSLSSFP